MSCKDTKLEAKDVLTGAVDSFHDNIAEAADRADGNPRGTTKIAPYAKLGNITTVLSMADAALNGDKVGVAKALTAAVAGSIAGSAGTSVGLAIGGALLGAPAVGGFVLGAAIGIGAGYIVNYAFDKMSCQDPDPTEPYRPRPDESPTQGYKKQYYDPIILDLDGNGVGTVSKFGYHGAMFDHDGDGIATQAGWVAVNDEWWEMVV